MTKINKSCMDAKVLMVSALLLNTGSSYAMEFTKDLYLTTNLDLDSNIQMAVARKVGIARLSATPRLTFAGADDFNRVYLDTSLLLQKSSNEDLSQKRNDPSADIGWIREFANGFLTVNGRYNKTSLRATELTTTGQVFSDESQINKALNASFTYNLSEKISTTLGGGYEKQKYTGGNLIGLDGFHNKTLNVEFDYQYSEFLKPYVQLSKSKYNNDNSNIRIDSHNYLTGFTYQASPILNVIASIGVNHIDSGATSWIGSGSASYEIDEQSLLKFDVNRSVFPSGLGGLQKSDGLTVGYSRELDQLNRVGADYIFNANKSINNTKSSQLTAWFTRDINSDYAVRLSMQYRSLITDSGRADALQSGVSIIYKKLNF